MKTQYFLGDKLVAEFDENENLIVIDSSVIIYPTTNGNRDNPIF